MENYIDLINAYLNKTLSQAEVLEFEKRLQIDSEFTSIYKEHIVFLNGIERVNIIEEISKAKQNYIRAKWLKYFGITIGILLISILAYSIITKSKNVENSILPANNIIEFVSDSIETESEDKVKIPIDTISIENVISKPKVNIVSKKEVVDTILIKDDFESVNSTEMDIISFLKSVEQAPQSISINSEENFEMTLKEGTKISIPKDAFIDVKTGKSVSGEIDLKIKEYYKLSDILLANLSTKSDDRLLETGGMLYIEANKNGSKLKLKPEKELRIVFNNRGKENMQLFEGEKIDDNINWVLSNEVETNVTDELIGEFEEVNPVAVSLTEVPFQIKDIPTYKGCEEKTNDCTLNKIREHVSRKFDTDIIEELNISGRKRISTIIKFDEKGNVFEVVTSNLEPLLEEEVNRVLMDLPQMIPAKKNGKAIASQLLLPITLSDGIDELIGVKSDSATIVLNSKLGAVDNGYTLNSPKLGWINCDRFVRSKKRKIKYKLKIKDAEGANVKMIFKSISSVLPSKRINEDYSFGEIPLDEDVILLAIKKKGEKLFIGMKDVTTKQISGIDLDFKEVTAEELKNELIKLNKAFE
ncbi:hypothetical protein H8K90_04580 [Winogradskyella echinorum]|uniref:Uncharacterized protein n=1 Tax=Winogradskyella echinorum TaxID=538189 RepID=A0ABR6XYU0_9FLAO|nr:hypothetical protein [Winogradskyella echinorum]MBC3845641.1 hypothetical protein [Winogradskyella echinorum]MBC5749989.1 hypothetical protein [Winogradskyella echinorum]